MNTLEFNILGRERNDMMQGNEDKGHGKRSFWGVSGEEVYEKGWSSRIDRHTPALLSDSCVWYFEAEMTLEEIDSNTLEQTEERTQPVVSITTTISI